MTRRGSAKVTLHAGWIKSASLVSPVDPGANVGFFG